MSIYKARWRHARDVTQVRYDVVVGGRERLFLAGCRVSRRLVTQADFRVGSVVGERRQQIAFAAASEARDEFAQWVV